MKKKRSAERAYPKIKVKRSSAGLGLFAAEEILKGTEVIEYIGPILSNQESQEKGGQYLFEVSNRRTIDGSVRWNTARYINHSCKPNSEAIIKKGRVFIQTKRKITPNEEITYNYGKEFFNEYIKPKGCRCEKCSPINQKGVTARDRHTVKK